MARAAFPSLIHVGLGPDAIAVRLGGRAAVVLSPWDHQPLLHWDAVRAGLHREMQVLARAGVHAVSPAWQAVSLGRWQPDWLSTLVPRPLPAIVPDLVGWRRAPGLWQAVLMTLDRSCPVFLSEGA